MKKIKIGILDFGNRDQSNLSFLEIFHKIIKEATALERLGFSKIWYTEHYVNSPNCSWLSPQIILPLIASYTNHIRVGIAGVLSLYHNSISIASDFKLLNNLFSDRIDLGFAKGSVIKQYDKIFKSDEYNTTERRQLIMEKISLTIDMLRNEQLYLNDGITIPPIGGSVPEMWNLVSSPSGYIDSLELGINCSRTLFFEKSNLETGLDLLEEYKDKFYEKYLRYPEINIALTGTCQTSDNKVKKILNESKVNKDFYNDEMKIFGSPHMVYDRICNICELYNINEVIFVENSKDFGSRLNSFKNLSDIFELTKI